LGNLLEKQSLFLLFCFSDAIGVETAFFSFKMVIAKEAKQICCWKAYLALFIESSRAWMWILRDGSAGPIG